MLNCRKKLFFKQFLEKNSDLKVISIGLAINITVAFNLNGDSNVFLTIFKSVVVLSIIFLTAFIFHVLSIKQKKNLNENFLDNKLKKNERKIEYHNLLITNIPNYIHVQQKLRMELNRIGNLANLSQILEMKFGPKKEDNTMNAIISYKRLQDNRKAKDIINGIVFYGRALECQFGNEVEIYLESYAALMKNEETQTWNVI